MRWINDEAKAAYERWIAMGNEVLEEARGQLAGEGMKATKLLVLPTHRQCDRIIAEARRTAEAYFGEAAKIAAGYTMPEPVILDRETLRPLTA